MRVAIRVLPNLRCHTCQVHADWPLARDYTGQSAQFHRKTPSQIPWALNPEYVLRKSYAHVSINAISSPLSRRLSRPAAEICAKPASRRRKFRLSRELAEKNIRLSRRENPGLNAKTSITKVFNILKLIVNRYGLLYHPSALLCFVFMYRVHTI